MGLGLPRYLHGQSHSSTICLSQSSATSYDGPHVPTATLEPRTPPLSEISHPRAVRPMNMSASFYQEVPVNPAEQWHRNNSRASLHPGIHIDAVDRDRSSSLLVPREDLAIQPLPSRLFHTVRTTGSPVNRSFTSHAAVVQPHSQNQVQSHIRSENRGNIARSCITPAPLLSDPIHHRSGSVVSRLNVDFTNNSMINIPQRLPTPLFTGPGGHHTNSSGTSPSDVMFPVDSGSRAPNTRTRAPPSLHIAGPSTSSVGWSTESRGPSAMHIASHQPRLHGSHADITQGWPDDLHIDSRSHIVSRTASNFDEPCSSFNPISHHYSWPQQRNLSYFLISIMLLT
jgi:hypothetical protein